MVHHCLQLVHLLNNTICLSEYVLPCEWNSGQTTGTSYRESQLTSDSRSEELICKAAPAGPRGLSWSRGWKHLARTPVAVINAPNGRQESLDKKNKELHSRSKRDIQSGKLTPVRKHRFVRIVIVLCSRSLDKVTRDHRRTRVPCETECHCEGIIYGWTKVNGVLRSVLCPWHTNHI